MSQDDNNRIKRQKIDIIFYIDMANVALKSDDILYAKYNLDIIIEEDPLNIKALLLYAHIYIKTNEIDNLINCCKTILKIQPDNYHFHYNLANCYIKQKNIIGAEKHYMKSIELNPQYNKARYRLIYIYRCKGEIINLKIQHEQLLISDPLNKDAIFNLKIINKIINNIKDYYTNYYNITIDINTENDLKIIRNYIVGVIYSDLNNIPARLILSKFYFIENRLEESIILNQYILTLDKNNLEANYNLLKIYNKLNNYKDAEAICMNIINIDQKNNNALNSLAIIYYKQNELNKARIVCDEILLHKLENLYINTYYLIAKIDIRENKMEDAEIVIRKIIEIDKYNIQARELLLRVLNSNNKIKEAELEYDLLLENDFYNLLN